MFHRVLAAASVLPLSLALASPAGAQMAMNPRGDSKVTIGGKTIAVEYGRPSLKGRDMLGKAAVGQEWRMGADGATTFKTAATLGFGTVTVPPGDYVLRARKVSDNEWTLLFDQNEKVVAEVPLAASPVASSVEMFTIDLLEQKGQGTFKMTWGDRALAANFTAK
jgi:DUF2911 family protein